MQALPLRGTATTAVDRRKPRMDRETEPVAPYLEYPTAVRHLDQVITPRLWKMPVPLRVKHSGFKNLGLTALLPQPQEPGVFTLKARGFPSILTFPGSRHWLVMTLALPGGATPTDPFAGEPPYLRVDGAECKGLLTSSSAGRIHMGFIDLPRGTLSDMATRVLDREPESRILVRLLPRFTTGAVRWFQGLGCVQFWSAL